MSDRNRPAEDVYRKALQQIADGRYTALGASIAAAHALRIAPETTTAPPSSNLRVCPFCGQPPQHNGYTIGGKSFAWIGCDPCNIRREFNTMGEDQSSQKFAREGIARWWNGRAPETNTGPAPAQERDALAERCDWLGGRLQRVGNALQRLIEAGDQIEIPPEQLGTEPVFTVTGRLKDQRAFSRAMAEARESLKDRPAEKTDAVKCECGCGATWPSCVRPARDEVPMTAAPSVISCTYPLCHCVTRCRLAVSEP